MFGQFFHSYNKISVSDLATLLESPEVKRDVAFIDVRRGDEWNSGHIADFTHIALSELPLHTNELMGYKKIYFICRSGGRSEKACDIMKAAGYENSYTVNGGIMAWAEKELPVIR